ncbi:formate dehydrogenase accessory sulfurtransferase FdhD [Coraliomargarita sp. SDUM461004]|uniref:Sulfur carrier protein FdhD n=1 Tax=Thalassobacterium sedimentorum TaxID=3041258 RepID=A0ABU1APE7_9BACT|nr:formate dehydrogenase accessory sulfurtransferase FdhD [Coraliomargarita sp. SDUM461004]MDQ8196098.1 formate dehydrogenase accessory sulfurtransferase FdhD [Coraliomargarita sp. SDUM461004]
MLPSSRRLPRTTRTSVKVIKQHVQGQHALPPEEDYLAIEDPLEIVLAYERHFGTVEKKLIVTMRTPGHDEDLIHGFLYCEGIIGSAADIVAIQLSGNNAHAAPTRARVQLRPGLDASAKTCERNFAVHSSCGVCGTTSIGHLEIPKALNIDDDSAVAADWIHSLPAQMHDRQATFRQTGGLHASAIFSTDGSLQVSREDIGRHNALDKAIGANLIAARTPAKGQVLCVSGRMSYEIIQKALIARIPIITGVGAPSSMAVALANDFNITLIGFVRNDSYNIYSCPERIKSL